MRISDWSSDVCSSDLVHIAFDHEHAAGLAGSGRGAIEIVERAALVEQRGFGRIQIFGLAVADDAAAESDHAAARVADRDHQAAAEAIIEFLALDPDPQAGLEENRNAARTSVVSGQGE